MEKHDGNNNQDYSSLNFGLSVIPVHSNKIPALKKWKQYQSVVAPVELWHPHYIRQGTVGIITGMISENIECLDVDVKNDPTGRIWEDYKLLIPPDLLARLIIQTTPNKGYHLVYRCPDAIIGGNQKLALHTDQSVILETRGEGG